MMLGCISVDGVWEEWSSWTACVVTCGGSIQSRARTCDGPYYGGQNCTGEDVQEQMCNDNPCPGKNLLFPAYLPEGIINKFVYHHYH